MNKRDWAILILILTVFWLSCGLSIVWGQCQKWNCTYSPEIRCDYLEYFGLPRQAFNICLTRQDSKIAPGDYYQEPGLEHCLKIDKTSADIKKFADYLKIFLKPEYICERPADLFETYLIFGDSLIRMGPYSRQVSYPDSSRREFFSKFTIDSSLIFVSGWFDKFISIYINIECDSVTTAMEKARELLELEIAPLNSYSKSVFETTRSDVHKVDSSKHQESAISETRQNTFYRFIDSDKIVWHLFNKNVALISGTNPSQQQITGVKRYWVVSVTSYIDKQYIPPWIKSPQK
jgi:hypothetical protein